MNRTNFIFLIIYFAHDVCVSRADYGSEIFPSLKSYRFNWFKRQIDGSTRRPTSTDLCDEKEFKEFTFDQNKCQRSAFFTFLRKYDFRASDLENEKTTCNKYQAQVKCFDEGGPKKLKCWDELTKETKKTQFLFKKYQKLTLFGSSIVNGKKFVNTCSAFENFEENYLRMETGCSTCCTLSEFDRKWRKKERCLNRALSKTKRQRRIGLKKKGEDGRNFLIQTECKFKEDWEITCLKEVSSCYSDSKLRQLFSPITKLFIAAEEKLDAHFDGFNYDTSCS